MQALEFTNGLASLNSLAQSEYHQSLSEIIGGDDGSIASLRIGRLVGVLLKTLNLRGRESFKTFASP